MSGVPNDPTTGQNTERLNEMAFAFKNSQAMMTAIELGLFDAIEAGAGSNAEIAAATGMPAETADRLAIVCRAMKLIDMVDGRYRNYADVSRYLVKNSRTYFGDYLVYTVREDWPVWTDLVRQVRGDPGTEPSKYYLTMMQDPDAARRFTEAGYNASIALAHRLAKRFDFSRFRHWLDLGGGSGCYAIAACEHHPDLKVTLLDMPNVIAVAEEIIAKHGLSERIATTPGEFFATDYPTGCDLASFITPLQNYGPEEVVALLRKVHAVLPSGGAILIVDYMLADDKAGPLDPALYNLQGIRGGQYVARVNSGAEFTQFLNEAGFADVEVGWLLEHQLGQVVGWKL